MRLSVFKRRGRFGGFRKSEQVEFRKNLGGRFRDLRVEPLEDRRLLTVDLAPAAAAVDDLLVDLLDHSIVDESNITSITQADDYEPASATKSTWAPSYFGMLAEIANVGPEGTLESLYGQNVKYLGYVSASIPIIDWLGVSAGVDLYVDLADYYSSLHEEATFSDEGHTGDWVTVWVDVHLGLGVSALPVGGGIIPIEFGDVADPSREWSLDILSSSLFLAKLNGFSWSDSGFDWGTAAYAPSTDFSASVIEVGLNVARFEVQRDVLDAVVDLAVTAGSPVGSITQPTGGMLGAMVDLADALVDTKFGKVVPTMPVRKFTKDDSAVTGVDGVLNYMWGGLDVTEDGAPDNYYPVMPDILGIPYMGVPAEVTFQNTGETTASYFVKVSNVPSGWLVGAVDGGLWAPIVDRKVDISSVSPSDWNSENEDDNWVTTEWAIAVTEDGPDYADVTFSLYHDRRYPASNALLDSKIVGLYKYTDETNSAPTLDLSGPSTDTTVTQGDIVTIQWTDSDPDDNAIINLGWIAGLNQGWLAVGLQEDSEDEDDQYHWDTSGVAPGTYTIWGMISDGQGDGHTIYDQAPGLVTVQEEETVGPRVLYTSPIDGGPMVARDVDVTIEFSEPMEFLTLNSSTIQIVGSNSGLHDGIYQYSGNTLVVDPDVDFSLGETVMVTVTRDAISFDGQQVAEDYVSSFTVIDATPVPIEVSGTLSATTTWTSGNVYHVTSNLTVPDGITLRIEPGTVVKLNEFMYIEVDGVLIADGTASEQIVFTSVWDDTYGGDTGDGGYPWRYLRLDVGSDGSLLDHVLIRNGGRHYPNNYSPNDNDMVLMHSNSVISNSTIEHGDPSSDEYGVSMSAGELRDSVITNNGSGVYADGTATLTGNTIRDSVYGVYLNGEGTVEGNTISGSTYGIYLTSTGSPTVTGNTIMGSSSWGIYMSGAGTPIITGNVVTGNAYGMHQGPSDPIYSGNDFSGNTNSVIGVGGTLGADVVWEDVQGLGMPYLVRLFDFY